MTDTSVALLDPLVIAVLLAAAILVPLAGVWGFKLWMFRNSGLFSTQDERIKAWDVFMKGCSAVTIFVAGMLSFLQYLHSQEENKKRFIHQAEQEVQARREEIAQRTREANLKIYETAGVGTTNPYLFHEVVDVASTLAAADRLDDPEAKIARNRFERLYWGQLPMVEKQHVMTAMMAFREGLEEWKNSETKQRPQRTVADVQNLISKLYLEGLQVEDSKLNPAKKLTTDEIEQHAQAFSKLVSKADGDSQAENQNSESEVDWLQAMSLVLAYACRHEIVSAAPTQ